MRLSAESANYRFRENGQCVGIKVSWDQTSLPTLSAFHLSVHPAVACHP
jgi:hypothetical protein